MDEPARGWLDPCRKRIPANGRFFKVECPCVRRSSVFCWGARIFCTSVWGGFTYTHSRVSSVVLRMFDWLSWSNMVDVCSQSSLLRLCDPIVFHWRDQIEGLLFYFMTLRRKVRNLSYLLVNECLCFSTKYLLQNIWYIKCVLHLRRTYKQHNPKQEHLPTTSVGR